MKSKKETMTSNQTNQQIVITQHDGVALLTVIHNGFLVSTEVVEGLFDGWFNQFINAETSVAH
jgi:hypothetical protein